MYAQDILRLLQQHYAPSQLDHANRIFAENRLQNCWKDWLSAEILNVLLQQGLSEHISIDLPYPNVAQIAGRSDAPAYLTTKAPFKSAKACEKRYASKCDFAFNIDDQQLFVEMRCANTREFLTTRENKKFSDDFKRVKALQQRNENLNILVLFALYGCITPEDMQLVQQFDNSHTCSYVWDTGLTGSTSIGRLAHVQRNGEARLLIIAHNT